MKKDLQRFSLKRLPSNRHQPFSLGLTRRSAVLGSLVAAGSLLRPFSAKAFTIEVRDSPFPRVKEREGFLSWRELESLARRGPASGLAVDPEVAGMQGQTVNVEGFMMPYDAGPAQTGFMITAYQAHCFFCMPGSLLSIMEVSTTQPVMSRTSTVMLRGKLELLDGSEDGLLFRLKEATAVG